MNSKDLILASVRQNRPLAIPLPTLTAFPQPESIDLQSAFTIQLKTMGGEAIKITDLAEVLPQIEKFYPEAKVIGSAVQEITGTLPITPTTKPQDLAMVDVAIVRAQFGVAETAAVWLTQEDLVVNALAFLTQHLIVILDSQQIVPDMHAAYHRIDVKTSPYGVFIAGPSATGDIEAVIIHGAQGPRSLKVFLL